jgi:hypothetical protein
MKRKISVLLFIGLALLFTFVVFGGQTVVRAKGAIVPFKVTCQTYPNVVPGDGYLEVKISSDCTGAHLGKSHWDADSIVELTTPPPFTQAGEMVFIAANGDQLIGTFSGQALPKETGGFDYWGDYEITGGTGRFSGTTASGTYFGGADGEVGTAVFEGTLTKP